MRISDIYQWQRGVLSLEVFPPKPGSSLNTVFKTLDGLRHLKPSFISVTYSPDGAGARRTVEIASRVRDGYGCESLAHLTCTGQTRTQVQNALAELQGRGIVNILALRGDIPENQPPGTGDYLHANQLIEDIASRGGFCIGAAAYPEGHHESRRISDDLGNLRKKVDSGAEFLITQLFFDNRVFFDYLERARGIGIGIPVIPGIMPIMNYRQIRRIIEMCRVSIPATLLTLFEKYSGDPSSLAEAGVEYAIGQIRELLDSDVEGVHLYTMNRVEAIERIVRSSGLGEHIAPAFRKDR